MGWAPPDFEKLKKLYNTGATIKDLQEEFGGNYYAIRGYLRAMVASKQLSPRLNPHKSTGLKKPIYAGRKIGKPVLKQEVTGGQMTLEFDSKKRIKTIADLVAACEIDLFEWEIERIVCNKWEVGAKNDDGVIVVEPLFQVKAWLKRSESIAKASALIAMFKLVAGTHAPEYKAVEHENKGEHLAVIPLPDAHFGKLSWGPETGSNYDVRIAEAIWKKAASDLLPKAQVYGLERIALVVGNDVANSDNLQGNTTAGTPQDNDSRIYKVLFIICMSYVWLIEQARLLAPVQVICVPGNHDQLLSYVIALFLWAWFRNCDDVEVDIEPGTTKFIEYGLNLIMLAHGDKLKIKSMPIYMATQAPKPWGRTKFWEALTGHFHAERAFDEMGVIVRTCKALCAPDAWHKNNGYLGRRGAEAFIYHKKTGPCGHLIYNIQPKTRDTQEKHPRSV